MPKELVKEKQQSALSFDDIIVQEPEALEALPHHNPLLDVIHSLPREQCELLLMLYYYGFSRKKAAEILSINYATLRKRLQRAKSALRTALEKMR